MVRTHLESFKLSREKEEEEEAEEGKQIVRIVVDTKKLAAVKGKAPPSSLPSKAACPKVPPPLLLNHVTQLRALDPNIYNIDSGHESRFSSISSAGGSAEGQGIHGPVPQATAPLTPISYTSVENEDVKIAAETAMFIPHEHHGEQTAVVDKMEEKQKAVEEKVEKLIAAVDKAVVNMNDMMSDKVKRLREALVFHREVLDGVEAQTKALQALPLPEEKKILGGCHAIDDEEKVNVEKAARQEIVEAIKMLMETMHSSLQVSIMKSMKSHIQSQQKSRQMFEESRRHCMYEVLTELRGFFISAKLLSPCGEEAEEDGKTWTGSVSGGPTPSATALLQSLIPKCPLSQMPTANDDAGGEEAKGEEEEEEEEAKAEEEEEAEAESAQCEIVPACATAGVQFLSHDKQWMLELVHGLVANNAKLDAIKDSLVVMQETHIELSQKQSEMHGILSSVVQEQQHLRFKLDGLVSQPQKSGRRSLQCSSGEGSATGSFTVVDPGDGDDDDEESENTVF